MEMFLKIAPGVACLLFWLHALSEMEKMENRVNRMEDIMMENGLIPEEVED